MNISYEPANKLDLVVKLALRNLSLIQDINIIIAMTQIAFTITITIRYN